MWYPCIGSKVFPYTEWRLSYKESAWDTLKVLGELYDVIYKAFRIKYKWTPKTVDVLPITRILKIFEELIEENEKNPHGIDEDDLE